LTVADLVVAVSLILPFQTALDGGFRKAMQNVTNLVDKIIKLPEVVKRLGNVKFALKVIKAVVAPKKEEAKKEAPKKAAHTEDGEEEEKPAKKEANPLDILPPSPFDLYSFKTFFVNSKDKRGEGMKFFFENYDKAGYCVYFIHYEKYEGEGTVLYQTANGMNGFLQRVDNFRKHTFAMHAILGEEPNLEIMGVWLFRGTEVPQEMKDNPQFEYYKIRELSLDNEADKDLITDFWCAKPEDTIRGLNLKVQECKMHK